MSSYNLLMLPGDGIGPEVIKEVERVIEWFNKNTQIKFEIEHESVGGAAYDIHGVAISEEAMDLAHKCDAIIFGAVGGPKWDSVPFEVRPEAGLLRLRKDLDLFANLRPAICYKALADASSLKRELVEGLDILILRELTGGVYFGEPKEIIDLPDGQKKAIDTQVYTTSEIERIARVAFELAKTRKGKVTSTEKKNVMISGVFWNNVVTEVHKNEYPDIIREIRGRGLLIGIQLKIDQAKFIKKLMDNNLLTIRAAENVVRVLPPLNVKKNEIDQSLKIIKTVCSELT